MPDFLFAAKKIIATLVTPPTLPLILIAMGLMLIWRTRWARPLAWGGWVLLVGLSVPGVVAPLTAWVEGTPPLDPSAARGAQAIVILGAGRNLNTPEYGGQTVGRFALERLRYGARLAKQLKLPVLVSGGVLTPGPSEAVLMKAVLEQDFGVPVRWAEGASLDTRDNAQFSAQLLREAGVKKIVLVTHALHMPRALREFSTTGLTVVPAPTAPYDGEQDSNVVTRWLPSAGAAAMAAMTLRELLGSLAFQLREWVPARRA